MKSFDRYKSEDFLKDEYFIEWVIKPTSENEEFWSGVRKKYPEIEVEIEIAISFIESYFRAPVKVQELSSKEIDDLWHVIERSTISKPGSFRRFWYGYAAAIILILSGSFWLIHGNYFSSVPEIGYKQLKAPEGIKEVSLILADKRELKLTDEDSNIIYNPNGKLIINSSKQIIQDTGKAGKADVILNQIIVPNGKRSSVIFSDGTTLWINSGSRAIYPVIFDKKLREIYVEGEVFLDVAKDENRPFIVRTDKLEIKVFGTSFNVNAYPEDKNVTIVLVRGSIKVKSENQKELNVSPNQALVYSRQTEQSQISRVDIYNYITWKDGWLRCESEEAGSVFNKLSKYYNKTFAYKDASLKQLNLSGKLELKDDLDTVLEVISLTTSLKFSKENDTILVSK